MSKGKKHIHRVGLIILCSMLLCYFSFEVKTVHAAGSASTISTVINSTTKKSSSKKKTTTTKKNSSKKNTAKSKNAVNTLKKMFSTTTKAIQQEQARLQKEYATSNDYSWITKGSTGDKNFDKYITNFKSEVSSIVKFLTVVAIVIAGASIRIVGVKYACAKSGMKKREIHEQLITIFLVICAILGLGTIFVLAQQIGESLF